MHKFPDGIAGDVPFIAGMVVESRTFGIQLHIQHAPHAEQNVRVAVRQHRAVRSVDKIRRERILMLLNKGLEIPAADLLFAFD